MRPPRHNAIRKSKSNLRFTICTICRIVKFDFYLETAALTIEGNITIIKIKQKL